MKINKHIHKAEIDTKTQKRDRKPEQITAPAELSVQITYQVIKPIFHLLIIVS